MSHSLITSVPKACGGSVPKVTHPPLHSTNGTVAGPTPKPPHICGHAPDIAS